MLAKINSILAGLPMTVVAGIFLIMDLVSNSSIHGSAIVDTVRRIPFSPAWVSVIICGIPLLYLALWRVVHNPGISKISSALLISIAMVAAIALGDLFAAGEVAFIMSIGALLEEATTDRAKKGLKKLISLIPSHARKLKDGKESVIPASEIRTGDVLRILPGETIPTDGRIISGESSIDQSAMTGESLPVDKAIGDEVYCGTINRFGAIDITATKVGEDNSLQRLIRMVQEAEKNQAPIQRIADRCATYLVPIALMIAIAAYMCTGNAVTAVTILVVFCPCALILATPTAIMAAIGQATKRGVIIKSGEAVEKLSRVDTIAFDKTGTITYGNLSVSDILPLGDDSALRIISLAASAEAKSEHPLAKAVVAGAREMGAVLTESTSFRMDAGRGIIAVVSGLDVACGSERFISGLDIGLDSSHKDDMEKLRSQGKAVVILAIDKRPAGIIALSDTVRPEAEGTVAKLRAMGTETVLLTGDSRQTAGSIARATGIRDIRAELLPEDKVENIRRLQAEGRKVCMIGDGINDAPALKTADVSVAMGSIGSDIASDAADIVLINDDLSGIPYLKRLAVATVKTIRISIALSMMINACAILASLFNILNPTTGAIVHNAGSCFVVLIAALLYDRKFD